MSVAGTNAARQGCVLDLVAPAMDGFRAGTAGSPERGGGYHGVFPWSRATPTRRRSRSQTLGTAGHLAAPQRGSTGSPRLGASAIRERTCMHACAQPRRGRLTTINADKHASSKETKRAQHGWKTRRDGTPSDCTKKKVAPASLAPAPTPLRQRLPRLRAGAPHAAIDWHTHTCASVHDCCPPVHACERDARGKTVRYTTACGTALSARTMSMLAMPMHPHDTRRTVLASPMACLQLRRPMPF